MISDFPLGLFVLRHCRTEYNTTHRISGQSDSSIVDLSIETSALDTISIQQQKITIISSPLARCMQTVSYLLKQHNEIHPLIYVDSRIIERGMGCWEGKFKEDILRNHTQYCYCGQISPLITPPHGETFDEFTTRIEDFIQDLRIMAQNTPILICAHNQSLKLLKYRLVGGIDLLNFWASCSFKNGKVERIY